MTCPPETGPLMIGVLPGASRRQVYSTDEQIIGVLREAGTGASTGDLCRRHGISRPRPSTTGGRDLAAFRNLRAMISDGNRPDPTDLENYVLTRGVRSYKGARRLREWYHKGCSKVGSSAITVAD